MARHWKKRKEGEINQWKEFFYGKQLPPPVTNSAPAFTFDLQRFALDGITGLYTADEAKGNATQQSGDLFEVSDKNGGNKRYFSNIHAALNYVYDTDVEAYKETDGTYTATIKLLADVTDGKPFKIGGKMTNSGLSVKVWKSDITIDLDGHTYLFAEAINSKDLSKTKGIATEDSANTVAGGGASSASDASATIKNGTLGIAPNATSKFERLIRSYINLTLDSVTIDGSNFPVVPANTPANKEGLEKSFDGAIVCQSGSTLKIIGDTNIIAPEGYYAVAEKFANATQHGSNFGIQINTSGTISNLSIYEWNTNVEGVTGNKENTTGGFGAANNGISIGGGTIGEVMFSEKAVETGVMSRTTVNGGAVVNSITYGSSSDTLGSADSLAYMESTESFPYWAGQLNGKIFVFGQGGWNPDSTTEKKFNFVAESVESDNTNKLGQVVIAAEGASDTSSFAYDSANNVIGLPSDTTANWGAGLEDNDTLKAKYAVAKMDYSSSAKEAVTVSEVSLGSAGDSAHIDLVAKADSLSTSTGLFAETVKKIDASALSVAASIVGNSLDNTLYGGKGDDSLTGGKGTATSLRGSNTFYYSAGKDVITDFNRTTDKIVITDEDFAPAAEQIDTTSDFNISLSAANQLKLNGVANLATTNVLPTSGVKVAAERNGKEVASYVYTAYSVADMTGNNANGVTLGSAAGSSFGADNPFVTINAEAISGKFDIRGFTNANYILAGKGGGSLNGNGGDDTLRGGNGADVFVYSAGKNVIEEYQANQDVVDMATANITSAKSSRKGLVFSTKNSSNILTFKPVGDAEDIVEKVSLNGGGFLTKDGAVNSLESGMEFKLFAGTKGTIDLTDTVYGGAGIASIDASASKNSVTLTADSVVSALTFNKNNNKKDQFVYGGGTVSITGYEAGKDRLNIENAGAITQFEVDKESGDVEISVGAGGTNVISLQSAKDQEVLIHDEASRGNSYAKFVFHDTGVLYNKAKKPTEATVSGAAESLKADDSVKKIFAVGVDGAISIESGNVKSTLDASAAGVGVSLIGGAKNNKFIGSDGADVFVYKGGKDNIQDFVTTGDGKIDSIAFGEDADFSFNDAKISVSKKSIKLKFNSKNTLTLKGDSTVSSSIKVGEDTYTFSKNAYSTVAGTVSLTSAFSGSYKISKDDANKSINGSLVKKNLTFKGTSAQETLVGGAKKTTFKGGGGADSLVGGSGKDIFFYAKGDAGTSTIDDFDFGVGKDKLKIANGTISKIESLNGGGVQFAMTSGKKGDTSPVGYFKVMSKATYDNSGKKVDGGGSIAEDKVAIKANNTYYWFADSDDVNNYVSASTGNNISAGDLITFENKAKASDVSDCAIIDLGYSTNLAKTEVAIKVASKSTGNTNS